MEKDLKGMSIHTIFILGMLIASIHLELMNLFENKLGKRFILKDLKDQIRLSDEHENIKDKNKIIEEMKGIEKSVNYINEEISKINELLKELNMPKKISLLNVDYLSRIIQNRLEYVPKDESITELIREKFKLELSKEIEIVLYSINEIVNSLKEREEFRGLKDIEKNYKHDVKEAININSIGYGKTAVLCIGRAIENLINTYFIKLLEKKNISQQEYDKKINSEYNEKIGFLKQTFLTEEEFTDLMSFSFKRNKGGHPNLGEINYTQAKNLIQQGIWLIENLQKKINETKSENEIKDEKARERLGGTSLWGGPTLYGTSKEKLKQLEGYGGERIEEMREELKKDIEKEESSEHQ